jgi:hypothetical protein
MVEISAARDSAAITDVEHEKSVVLGDRINVENLGHRVTHEKGVPGANFAATGSVALAGDGH